jgi:WNK lysine deficient protein kinase
LNKEDSAAEEEKDRREVYRISSNWGDTLQRRSIEDFMYDSLSRKGSMLSEEFEIPQKDYQDEELVSTLVEDVAIATKRGLDKAGEWLVKLHQQDVMTIGDMRELDDDDWPNLYICNLIFRGLTVFAGRALRNALYGKQRSSTRDPKFRVAKS